MSPAERRLLVRVGIPGLLLFAGGAGLAITGDQKGSPPLMAVGFPLLGVGFVLWAVVADRLNRKASPELKAWQKAIVEGPAANKFNTALCSVLVVAGLVALISKPSVFTAAFAPVSIGMLVVFVRRGWPDRRS